MASATFTMLAIAFVALGAGLILQLLIDRGGRL